MEKSEKASGRDVHGIARGGAVSVGRRALDDLGGRGGGISSVMAMMSVMTMSLLERRQRLLRALQVVALEGLADLIERLCQWAVRIGRGSLAVALKLTERRKRLLSGREISGFERTDKLVVRLAKVGLVGRGLKRVSCESRNRRNRHGASPRGENDPRMKDRCA